MCTDSKEQPLLLVQQGQGLERIGRRVHRRHQRGDARGDVSPDTHVLLDIGRRLLLRGVVVNVSHSCTAAGLLGA